MTEDVNDAWLVGGREVGTLMAIRGGMAINDVRDLLGLSDTLLDFLVLRKELLLSCPSCVVVGGTFNITKKRLVMFQTHSF